MGDVGRGGERAPGAASRATRPVGRQTRSVAPKRTASAARGSGRRATGRRAKQPVHSWSREETLFTPSDGTMSEATCASYARSAFFRSRSRWYCATLPARSQSREETPFTAVGRALRGAARALHDGEQLPLVALADRAGEGALLLREELLDVGLFTAGDVKRGERCPALETSRRALDGRSAWRGAAHLGSLSTVSRLSPACSCLERMARRRATSSAVSPLTSATASS